MKSQITRNIAVVLSVSLAVICGNSAQAKCDDGLMFDLVFAPGVSSSPEAAGIMSGVSFAAGSWSSVLFDPVTISVSIELDSEATDIDLGTSPSVFAAAVSSFEAQPYTDVFAALTGDAKSLSDIDSLSLLQTGPFLEAITHDTSFAPGAGPSPEMRLGSRTRNFTQCICGGCQLF